MYKLVLERMEKLHIYEEETDVYLGFLFFKDYSIGDTVFYPENDMEFDRDEMNSICRLMCRIKDRDFDYETEVQKQEIGRAHV